MIEVFSRKLVEERIIRNRAMLMDLAGILKLMRDLRKQELLLVCLRSARLARPNLTLNRIIIVGRTRNMEPKGNCAEKLFLNSLNWNTKRCGPIIHFRKYYIIKPSYFGFAPRQTRFYPSNMVKLFFWVFNNRDFSLSYCWVYFNCTYNYKARSIWNINTQSNFF